MPGSSLCRTDVPLAGSHATVPHTPGKPPGATPRVVSARPVAEGPDCSPSEATSRGATSSGESLAVEKAAGSARGGRPWTLGGHSPFLE